MNKDEITQLVQDLKTIKTAVKRNRPLLRELSAAANFRPYFLFGGIVIVAVSLLFRYMTYRYGSYGGVPPGLKTALLILVGSIAAVSTLMKWRVARRVLARIDRRLTVGILYREFYSGWFYHLLLPQVLIAAAVVVYLALSGQGPFIIGAAGLALGVIMNLFGVTFGLSEYNVMGYWLLVTGALSFFLTAIPASVWSAICYGGACFTFVAVTDWKERRERTDEDRRG